MEIRRLARNDAPPFGGGFGKKYMFLQLAAP